MGGMQACAEACERKKIARRVFCDALALFVGPGRRHEAEEVGSAAGLTADTIRRYLRGETCPEWENAMALLAVLPVEFATAVLRPAGLTGLRRIDGDSTPGETLRDVVQAAAALADALADGRIDHTELPRIRRELTEAMVAIAQFLAQEGAEA